MKLFNYQKAYTHADPFHADDVCSTALLRIINPSLEIVRVGKLPADTKDGIVYDIGFGKYDHHQPDVLCRKNGVKYASFGLLWLDFADQVLMSLGVSDVISVKAIVDACFVQAIDARDNGQVNEGKVLPEFVFSDAIFSMNCQWDDENSSSEEAFEAAVALATTVLLNQIRQAEAKAKASNVLSKMIEAVPEMQIFVLPYFIPWQSTVMHTKNNILFVVYPSVRGGFNVQSVRDRISFPLSWRGKNDADLCAVSEVQDATFCHTGGFIANAATCDGAVKMAQKAIEMYCPTLQAV